MRAGSFVLAALASVLSPLAAVAQPGAWKDETPKKRAFFCSSEKCHADAATLTKHAPIWAAHTSTSVQVSCTECHAGDPKGETEEAGHAAPGPHELLRGPRAAAACVQCHVPGAHPGTEPILAAGKIYLELGCQLCHKVNGFGHYEAFAPPLDAIGLRGTKYLREVLYNPSKYFDRTPMPRFERILAAAPEKEEALITLLLSYRGPTPKKKLPASGAPCVSCHVLDGTAKHAAKLQGTPHRCLFIKEQKAELECARCHARSRGAVTSQKECLYIGERRRDCGVCHPGAGP